MKPEPSGEKRLHRDFVRGVQHDRPGPPRSSAPIGQRRGTETGRVRRLELERPARREVERRQRRRPPLRIRERVLNRQPHVGDAELRDDRSVARAPPSSARSTAGGRRRRSGRAGTSNSQRASMTSRPLFISVAESMVIFRPICQVGCRSASAGVTRSSALGGEAAERAARRGQDQPPHLVRLTRRAGTGGSRCARCRPAGSRRRAARAASITSAPAITSTSLLASAIVLPASIAASTASSAAVPDDAHSTTSTSGCVATAIRPSAPRQRASPARRGRRAAGAQLVERRRRSPRRPAAAGTARPARRAARAFSPAASATTRSRSGCASTTASALRPIDPVEPRIAMRASRELHARMKR